MLFKNLLGPTAPVNRPPTTRLGLPPARRNPWQRVGRTLLAEATRDPDIAMRQAGLDWSVSRVDMRCADTLDPVPGFAAIRRSDTSALLGVVGSGYEPFSNSAMFQVFKDLARVGRQDGGLPFTIETAGSFQGGKVVWALAHLPDLTIRIGEDESRTCLLVSTGHNGNRPITIAPTTIRVVCQNTLSLALRQIRDRQRHGYSLNAGFSIRHTTNMLEAVANAKRAYADTLASHGATVEAYQHLAAKPLTAKMERTFFDAVFGRAAPDESDRARAIRKSRDERLAAILASPTSQVIGTKETAFSLLQAAVEFIDHDRTTRSADETDPVQQRLLSATWGSGADLKVAAWAAILDLTRT